MSCGQQKNAVGVTVHYPTEIILLILWVSHKFGSSHKFRSIWLASVRLAFCLLSSVVIYHELHKLSIMQNCPWNKLIDVPRSCWKRKSFENFNLPFACCRISQWDVQHLILVDSDDSPWGRLHGQMWMVFHFIRNCIKMPWCPRRHLVSHTLAHSKLA